MSIQKNFIYSSILTISNYIFPLLVFPYVSRVLGVEKIGICGFVDSVTNYFLIFAMMGINILGVRESAKYKNKPKMLNLSFSNLLILNSISTVIMIILCLLVTFTVPKLYQYKELMIIGTVKIIFTLFAFEWFFKGTENFKYITSRGLIIRFLYIVCVFVFVRNSNNYIVYYALTVLMIAGNAIIDILYVRKFVVFTINSKVLKTYISPFLILGLYTLLTSMYTSFNIAYLGFISNEKEVGYYTTAIKLYSICLSLFTAFTGVMLPRMSILVMEKKFYELNILIEKSFDVLLSFSIPIVVLTTFYAAKIINIIAGNGYEGAIFPMKIVMPLMIIIGIEQILIIQLLMPLKKEKIILRNSLIGAFVGVSMNLILVPLFRSVGSSIVLVISELVVLFATQIYIQKNIDIKFPFRKIIQHFIYILIPMSLICFLFQNLYYFGLWSMVCSTVTCALYFLTIHLFVLKNQIIIDLINKIGLFNNFLK